MIAGRGFGSPAMLFVSAVIVVTTASALIPLHEPRLPGTLHLGAVQGADPATLHRTLGPLATYLGRSVRRTAEVDVLPLSQIAARTEVMIVPSVFAERTPGTEILTWIRPVSGPAGGAIPVLVVRRGVQDIHSLAVGDSLVLGGPAQLRSTLRGRGIDADRIYFGASVYDHSEALALLRHDLADAAIVVRSAVDRAIAAGTLRSGDIEIKPLVPAQPHLALVASSSLSEPARHKVRQAVLELDHYRFDPTNEVARSILPPLAEIGIGGFVPSEPLPALRR